ncbi:MAG: hypothetical protein KDB23_14095, partial [Planctomycetales bacterium]|nr:hypothetical protein [Planctomycetales bacterium]
MAAMACRQWIGRQTRAVPCAVLAVGAAAGICCDRYFRIALLHALSVSCLSAVGSLACRHVAVSKVGRRMGCVFAFLAWATLAAAWHHARWHAVAWNDIS